jgi:hypothetical protein
MTTLKQDDCANAQRHAHLHKVPKTLLRIEAEVRDSRPTKNDNQY